MGIKEIFHEGIKEFKRRASLRRGKHELQQKEKLYGQQLTALGQKAWEAKIDITAYNNLKDLISGSQQQQQDQKSQLEQLENQKQDTEATKKQKNEAFDARRKETEEKKKEVDFRLDKEKKTLKETQKESANAANRLNQISREEEQLKKRNESAETTDIEKEQNRRKLDAFILEKEQLQQKIRECEGSIKTTNENIAPIEAESQALQKQIDDIRAEQKQVIGDLDKILADTKGKINACNTKLKELNKEQDGYFEQLGRNLAGAGAADEAVRDELAAVRDSEKAMTDIKGNIDSLDQAETAASRGAFWKMIWLIVACVVVIIAIIIALSMLFGSKDKTVTTPGNIFTQALETKSVPPQVADTIEKYQQKIARTDGQDKTNTPGQPGSMEESMKQMNDATGELKKQSEQIQGKEIIAASKEALVAALPRISGWEMTEPSYNKGNFGQLETAHLDVTYKGPDDKDVKVTITDTATASAILHTWEVIFQMNIIRDDSEGYQKITKVNDIPVIERFDKQSKRAQLSFIIKKRYVVELTSKGQESLEFLKRFITQMNLAKLD